VRNPYKFPYDVNVLMLVDKEGDNVCMSQKILALFNNGQINEIVHQKKAKEDYLSQQNIFKAVDLTIA
jgi:hypothetical protein